MEIENRFRILLIEGDAAVRAAMEDFLRVRGFEVWSSPSGSAAVRRIREEQTPFDVILADATMAEPNSLEVLSIARQSSAETQVVTITSFATLDVALESVRQGAFDYITKPFKFAQIEVILNKVADRKRLLLENRKLSERVQSLYTRLDLLKENRDRLERFMRETSERLDQQSARIEDCCRLLQRVTPEG